MVNAKGEVAYRQYRHLVGAAMKEARLGLRGPNGVVGSVTQEEFAEILANFQGREKPPLSRVQIRRIERGESEVTAATLVMVADMVGYGVNELLAAATRNLVYKEVEQLEEIRQPGLSRVAQLLRGLRKADAVDEP